MVKKLSYNPHKPSKIMRINFYKGKRSAKELYHSYYIHPTLKLQPYGKAGFELVLWFIKYYVSIRVTYKTY